MSSPDEPGYPRTSERSGNANGLPAVPAANGYDGVAGHTAGPATDSGDVPPWQRAANRAEKQRPDPEQPVEAGSGNSPEARLNRFMSGGSAPPTRAAEPDPTTRVELPSRTESRTDTRSERTELARPEAYASELPDLSGPVPRPPQRRPPGERPSQPEPANRVAAVTSRIQVAHQPRGPVRASMQIRRVDPWTVLKVSLVLSVALFFIWMISVAFLYLVLGGMGVWSKLNSNVGDLLTSASGTTGGELVSSGTIFGGAGLIGLVNIVLLTAMATIGAFIYNLTTDLVGGVEVTLADRD